MRMTVINITAVFIIPAPYTQLTRDSIGTPLALDSGYYSIFHSIKWIPGVELGSFHLHSELPIKSHRCESCTYSMHTASCDYISNALLCDKNMIARISNILAL